MSGINLNNLYKDITSKWGKKNTEGFTKFIEQKTGIEMENVIQTLATKEDLHKVELRLDGKINNVKAGIEKMKFDLIKWVVGLRIAQTILMLTLK
jgi:hypothetical protein